MKQLIPAFIVILLLPFSVSAESINAGFVQGIWYADTPVLAEKPTRVYIALRNNTEHDLSGIVRFTDNGKRIGTSEVRALSGRLVEAWVDWTPEFGTHSISATMSEAKIHKIGGETEPIDISGIVAESILFVDKDNDNDGIGDTQDDDDDNDSIPDDDEIAQGSDPLDPDSVPEDEVEEAEETADRQDSSANKDDSPTAPKTPRDGLEKYITQDPINNILAGFTETIQIKKQDLDTYRTSRIIPGSENATATDVQLLSSPITTSTETHITRAKTEPKQGVFEKLLDGFMLLFFHLWSFVLWVGSVLLSFPALIEILGLILFLYILLRLVRRVARRPQQ